MRVGFIGLGHMGAGMAANLLASGHEVTVYNRTPGRAHALVARGAHAAGRVPDACRGEAVVTMLADDAAVEGVVFDGEGILGSLGRGAIHVSMSTIGVALSERLAAAHTNAGQRFVAAPVFGRPDAAAAAKLFILAAGAPDALDACSPLFESMGQKTFPIGNAPPAANLVKLSGNFLMATVIEALGEAMALVEKAGVDRHRYLDFLTPRSSPRRCTRRTASSSPSGGSRLRPSPRRWDTRTSGSPSPWRKRCACPCRSPACCTTAS